MWMKECQQVFPVVCQGEGEEIKYDSLRGQCMSMGLREGICRYAVIEDYGEKGDNYGSHPAGKVGGGGIKYLERSWPW